VRDPRRQWIELGSGNFGTEDWFLVYAPEPWPPPDEHHISSPTVALQIAGKGANGRPPGLGWNSGPLGRLHLCVRTLNPPRAHIFGEVDYRFDRVNIHCLEGSAVEAVVVDCRAHLPFNYYVAPVSSQVLRVTASGPEGQMATRDRDR
jgi:hypothetical protein